MRRALLTLWIFSLGCRDDIPLIRAAIADASAATDAAAPNDEATVDEHDRAVPPDLTCFGKGEIAPVAGPASTVDLQLVAADGPVRRLPIELYPVNSFASAPDARLVSNDSGVVRAELVTDSRFAYRIPPDPVVGALELLALDLVAPAPPVLRRLRVLMRPECFGPLGGECPKVMPYDGPRGQGGLLGYVVDCQNRPVRGACISLVDGDTGATIVGCDSKAIVYFTSADLPDRTLTSTSRAGVFVAASIATASRVHARAEALISGVRREIAGRDLVLREQVIVSQVLDPGRR